MMQSPSPWRPALLLVAALGLSSCADDGVRSGSDSLCEGGMFRGVVYETVGPATKSLPEQPRRGERIGRTTECDDDGGVAADGSPTGAAPVWLEVFELKGVDPDDGIYVEGWGPVAPVLTKSDD